MKVGFITAGLLFAAASASASTMVVPPADATYSVGLYDGLDYVHGADNARLNVSASAPGSYADRGALGSVSGNPLPTVSAMAQVRGFLPAGQMELVESYASLTYNFRVEGGPRFSVVPLQITVHLKVTGNTPNGLGDSNRAVVNINHYDFILQADDIHDRVDGTFAFDVFSGHDNFIALSAFATTTSDYNQNSSAFVDPVIAIDPVFAAAHPGVYSLLFSPGIGNGAPANVPEPASALGLGLGMVTLTTLARRRRAGTTTRGQG